MDDYYRYTRWLSDYGESLGGDKKTSDSKYKKYAFSFVKGKDNG